MAKQAWPNGTARRLAYRGVPTLTSLLHHRRTPAVIGWLLSTFLLLAQLTNLLPQPIGPAVALAAGTPCTTSGPANGAYSIKLCLTAPLDGATLSGEKPV